MLIQIFSYFHKLLNCHYRKNYKKIMNQFFYKILKLEKHWSSSASRLLSMFRGSWKELQDLCPLVESIPANYLGDEDLWNFSWQTAKE